MIVIQSAEDYIDYDDTTPGVNLGGAYRNDGVDIEKSSEGGYNVGWIDKGEWLEYSIEIPAGGTYHFTARVASPNDGNEFQVKMEQKDAQDEAYPKYLTCEFDATGDWQRWTTVEAGGEFTKLKEGTHVLTLTAKSSGFNLNYFDIDRQWLADGFIGDENSLISPVPPLIGDDTTRGYSLHPEVLKDAHARGVSDLGSNGLNIWEQAGIAGFNWATYGDGFGVSSAPAGSPAGYTWDVDASQHVVYRDTDGHIQELFYHATDGEWRQSDLTEAAGKAPLATGSPAGYTWDVDDSQHVIYRDIDGRIQELYYQAADGLWHQNDLTEAAGKAPFAAGSPAAYTWDVDDSQHVVYRDVDGRIQELYYKAAEGDWHQNDLTEAAGVAPLATGVPAAYTWDADDSQHVIYRDADGRIQELYYKAAEGEWYQTDLTEAAGKALLATGSPAAYTWDVDDSQHVVYRDADGRIQELYYKAAEGEWYQTDLTEAADSAPLATGSPAGYTWDVDASQHVVYRNTDAHIQELYYQADDGLWDQNDLTDASATLVDGI